MLNSDSEDDVLLVEGRNGRGNTGRSDGGEPPRRRMRMDPDVAPPTTTTGRSPMTLRSGRAVRASEANPVGTSLHESDFDSNGDDEDGESLFGNDSTSSTISLLMSVPNPGSSHNSSGLDVSLASVISTDSDGTIDLDLHYDSDQASFEAYDIDQLSDVPVSRSPEVASGNEDSEDGDSLFGAPPSPSSSEPDGGRGGEGPQASWERRRLQRRNAIVLESNDSPDGVSDDEGMREENQPITSTPISSTNTNVQVEGDKQNIPTTSTIKPISAECNPSEEDDTNACIICCEPFTNSGEHRLCCLKCGHTYGKKCIEKWIKNEARCPQCNSKAAKKDLRILYVKNLVALDTAERDRLLLQLESEQEEKRKLELQCTRLRQMANEKDVNYQKLAEEFRYLKDRVGSVYRDPGAQSKKSAQANSSNLLGNKTNKKFNLIQSFPFKDGDCRVGAYESYFNMLAVSQTVKSALYPQGCYGVKKINLLDMRSSTVTPLHHKEIRDLEFSNSQGDILLSVGLDKKAILTNCTTNVTVQVFTAESPLWSCTWGKMGQHVFYTGTANGQVLAFDVRRPGDVLKTLVMPSTDKTPIASVKFITPSIGNSGFNMSGLLVQKLSSCWFCELRPGDEVRYHELPVDGSFVSADFEPISRHALISTRPSKDMVIPSRHMVCDLSHFRSDVQPEKQICTCNVIRTYQGHESQIGKLTRSSIFSPDDENVFVAAEVGGTRNSTSIWDISEGTPFQSFQARDPVLDFVPCRINNDFLLGMISANNLNIYKLLA